MRKEVTESIKRNGIFIASLLLIFIANFNYVINHFFVTGSGMLDVGWFTHLLTSSYDFPAKNPEIGLLGHTYFSTHISPFIYITTLIYKPLASLISQQAFFAIFMGIGYSLMALATYLAGQHRADSISSKLTLSIFSIFFALNGVFLGSMGFPHFEIIIPSLLLLILALYSSGHNLASSVAFFFLLLVREDAGLHAALLFATLSILFFIQYRKILIKPTLLAVIGILYSFSVIALQKIFFDDDNAFSRIYSGAPFYGHLTIDFLKDRIDYFISQRSYIWAPWLVAVASTIKTRNITILAGLISSIPWSILSLTATAPMTHELSNYYAFPLAISCVWPLFALFINERLAQNSIKYNKMDFLIAALAPVLSIALFTGYGHVDGKPWRDMDFNYVEITNDTQSAIETVCRRKDSLGTILVDEPVSALMPSCLLPGEWGYLNHFHDELKANADTIIFYDSQEPSVGPSIDKFLEIAEKSGIRILYRVSGTKILIGSKEEILKSIEFENGLESWGQN